MTTEQPTIETHALGKTYNPGKDDEVKALKGIDLRIPRHHIYALLGPNGAGKTTTLSILTTLIQPSQGSATVAGYDIVREPDQIRRRIGVTFQEIVLDDDLTGRQILDYHARLYRMSKLERHIRIEALLQLVELEEAADRVTRGYSGGMKRRLELTRGLISNPEILFLDEPTQGLDPQNRANMWSHIRDLRDEKGLTLLLTTHYIEEAQALADTVGIIDRGELIIEGTPAELIDELGSDVIHVTGAGDSGDYVAKLRELPFVQGVSAGRDIVQIGVDNGNRRLVDVIAVAGNNGFRIEDVSLAKPTLGDVFLKYTGRQLRDK
jgi:ABC-2 type transport system ATP-binding protein